MENFWL
jgi:hypothetical protein